MRILEHSSVAVRIEYKNEDHLRGPKKSRVYCARGRRLESEP